MEFSHTPTKPIRYFKNPTQIQWFDGEHGLWMGGIGVEDYIICGCCGGVVPLDEFYEEIDYYNRDAEEGKKVLNPLRILEWIPISDEILGDFS